MRVIERSSLGVASLPFEVQKLIRAIVEPQFSITTRRKRFRIFFFALFGNEESYCLIMSLDEKFSAAAASVKDMKSRPSDAELLELYALYKQATSGDCSIGKNGNLQFL
ncbi:hypothetical protein CEXT_437391 [Caerostris extrusa]|uniref:ACB domain-containing protein n=1 Tax=Caerostris extrusa TaxID=172846 RepID=A0AAV4XUJ1_CAEEX|nr:hypothetical protein CEXT_437391 [Caerostris extrusa]